MLSRLVASALIVLGLIVLSQTSSAARPTGPLKGLDGSLKKAGFVLDVQGWRDEATVPCQHRPKHPTCTLLGKTARLDVSLKFEKRTYDQTVWAITFDDDAHVERWLEALKTGNDLPFGKALLGVHRCDRYMAVTVGVFRGPNPHKLLDRAVKRHLAKQRCTKR